MIVTFYSFKGGVGRSMAMANIGAWLYRQKRRVLLVDWDLEAPGLESFFLHTQAELDKLRGTPGVVDVIESYRQLWERSPSLEESPATKERRTATIMENIGTIRHLFQPLADTSEEAISTREPGFWLFHAGCRAGASDEFYRRSVHALDWGLFYEEYGGYHFVEWLRRELEKDVDFVLLDSRTGLTEMSGVCTQHLADVAILLFAPNDSNLEGVRKIAELLVSDKVKELRGPSRPLTVFPIPARVDTQGATNQLEAFEKKFRTAFEGLSHKSLDWCWDSKIRYVTSYSYEESVLVLEEGGHGDLKLAYERIGDQILRLQEERLSPAEREHLVRARGATRASATGGVAERSQSTVQQLISTARVQMDSGDFGTASNLLSSAVALAKRDLGSEHPETLSAMNNLAASLYAQGDLSAARNLQAQVLEGSLRASGPENPETLTTKVNLAATLFALGEFAAARSLQEEALEVRIRVLGKEHPDTLTSMNSLAEILCAEGALAEARALQERVLEARRRVLGEEHPDTMGSMNDLARSLLALGEISNAGALQEQVLEARRRVLGEEHPDTLASMNDLVQLLKAEGNFTRARNLQEHVLEIRRRVLGQEHAGTLASMQSLAEIFGEQGDLLRARRLQEQVVEASRRAFGNEHPATCRAIAYLAGFLYGEGDLSAARSLQEQVLEIRRRILGEEHPDTLTSMNDLAQSLTALGELIRARDLQEQVLAKRRKLLGEEHPDTLTSMEDLAWSLTALHQLSLARDLQEQVLAKRRKLLGEEHPRTLASIANLARLHSLQGDLATARQLQQRAVELSSRILGADHPYTFEALMGLAVICHQQGELEQAAGIFQSSLELGHKLADRDPGNSRWRQNLGVCYARLGDVLNALRNNAGALAAYESALRIGEALALENPGDVQSEFDVSALHDKIGDALAAISDWAAALGAYRRAEAILQGLAERDPGDTRWQLALASSQDKIGSVLRSRGDDSGALAAFQKGFAIAQTVARPGSTALRKMPEEFLVAFSLVGEHRGVVRPLAEAVQKELGWSNVFFDEWFEHYLAGPDADLKLQDIYDKSALVVVCVSERYVAKPWATAEHAAIRARWLRAHSDQEKLAILPIRIGDGDLQGFLVNTIVPDIRLRDTNFAVRLILDRLHLIIPHLADGGRSISDWPSVSPPLIWQMANQNAARSAAGELLKRSSSFRILFLRGPSETGKSLIARQLLRNALQIPEISCGLFNCKGLSDSNAEVRSFAELLGVAAPPAHLALVEQLSIILQALKQRGRAAILVFDTFEVAGELGEWMETQLLPTVIRSPWLRVAVLGQRVPERAGAIWESVCSPIVVIDRPSAEDWFEYSREFRSGISVDFVRSAYSLSNGKPSILDELLRPRK
jgi:tetratricopeptide (TPR) repeat protein